MQLHPTAHLQKTCNPPFLGRNGTACPQCREEAAGNRTEFRVIWHIRSWVLQRREDGHEMLKENTGSRGTHSQREPRLGKKQNLSPDWTAQIIKRKKSLFSYLLTQRRYVATEANSSKIKGREAPVSSPLLSPVVFSRILLKSQHLEWGEPQLVPSDSAHSHVPTHYSCFQWIPSTCIECERFTAKLFRTAFGEVLQQQNVDVGDNYGFITAGNCVQQ